jgi:NAD(P)-dependent dehydrogenase (short-subunit alcohol dehydrogenase family)
VRGLNTYVPLYQARKTSKPSAIVITGSKLGITNPPGNPAYNASEAAVKSLAEHLSFDLRDSATNVHLLMPGWTHTGLVREVPYHPSLLLAVFVFTTNRILLTKPQSGNTPDSTTPTKPDGAWYASQVASYMYQKMKDYKFYIICPDNDVSEAAAKKRMLWSVGDMVKGRPPLSRWRPEFKAEAEKWMAECDMDEGSEVAGWCLIESAGL